MTHDPSNHVPVGAELGAYLGTVLGIWAHPDDEAYLSAGLMAAARRSGQRVVVATATAGERGHCDPPRGPQQLAALRAQELRASLAALGVYEHTFLGFADGACPLSPPAAAVDRLAGLLDQVRPDTVVTFGPEGLTGHPDHRAVSAWAGAAWQEAGRPGRLLHATLVPKFHSQWSALNDEIGLWIDGARGPSTPVHQLALTVELSGELLVAKYAALAAQASQTAPLIARLGEQTYRSWWSTEWFAPGRA